MEEELFREPQDAEIERLAREVEEAAGAAVMHTEVAVDEEADDSVALASDPIVKAQEERGTGINLTDLYMKQIKKTPLLNAQQEVMLAKRIEAGLYARSKLETLSNNRETSNPQLLRDLLGVKREGEQARDQLIAANLLLAVSIAKRYVGRGLALLDLIQEGNTGLLRAVERFDYQKGFKFSTYATWWIRQAITRAIADQERTIRLPVHMVEAVNTFTHHYRTLTEQLQRNPTIEEVAVAMDITPDQAAELRQYARKPTSLDQETTEKGAELKDLVGDADAVDPERYVIFMGLQAAVREVLHTLPSLQAQVIRERYGLEDGRIRTVEEVARSAGIKVERVRRIEEVVLRQLRGSADDTLASYWQ